MKQQVLRGKRSAGLHFPAEPPVTTSFMSLFSSALRLRGLRAAAAGLCFAAVAACGDGSDAPPSGGGPAAADAPVITQQPADLDVTSGQPASFTVVATGSAPLAYQWQRNGAAIAGATAASYALAAAAPTDTGVVFRVLVSNAAGTATSRDATLTVSTAPPVLSITQQPVDVAVSAGASAGFSVAATCSSGSLNIQWQRNSGADGAFVAIASATAASYTHTAAIADSGAQFRAVLDCGGQSAGTSSAATLTVSNPPAVVMTPVAINGLRRQAEIDFSRGIVRESTGSYAFVSGNAVLRLAADLQSITLIAGSVADRSGSTVDGVGAAARFNGAYGIAKDASGALYVTEQSGNVVRRVAPDGTVTTIAGSPGVSGSANGSGSAARFYLPRAIAIGPDGDLYVADAGNSVVRRVTTAGAVSTYAGAPGVYAYVDGPAAAARFNQPNGIAVADDGTVYVADANNNRIRRILRSGNAAGTVDTLAGNGVGTSAPDGTGTAAGVPYPGEMALAGGTLYVRDSFGLLRKIDTGSAVVTTLTGTAGATVPRDGPRGAAVIGNTLSGGALAPAANGGLLITETNLFLGAVRSVDASGLVTTIAVAKPLGNSGFTPGTGVLAQLPFTGFPNDATEAGLAQFSLAPIAIAAAPDGSLVLGTREHVRRIAPDGSVAPLIGLTGAGNFDGIGSAADAWAANQALIVDPNGVIYFSDAFNIRAIDSSRRARTLAGAAAQPSDGTSSGGAVDGPAASARFSNVAGLARAANGDLYASDSQNYAIRRIDAAGNVSTYAGVLGQRGTVDGAATAARFTLPLDLSRAPDGTLWLLDGGRNTTPTVRRVAADGSVSTLPTLARRLTVDPAGTIYVMSEQGDLASLDPTSGALTVLVRVGARLTLGSDPLLGPGSGGLGFTAVGIKQLVLISDGQLIRVTLP